MVYQMKNNLALISFLVFLGCGQKSTDTSTGEAFVADTLATEGVISNINPSGDELWDGRLEEFIQGRELLRAQLPSITSVDSSDAGVNTLSYYFDNGVLSEVYADRIENGAYAYQYFVDITPEDKSYLQFGSAIEDAFGYVGNTSSEWRRITLDGENKPRIGEECDSYKWNYEDDFADDLKFIRDNRDKFVTHEHNEGERFLPIGDTKGKAKIRTHWEVSEILFRSNLLSPTRFDPELIEGFLNWWYPVYLDASNVYYFHRGCPDDAEDIIINVEAGHYRWVEELFSGKSVDYTITAFEQGEGESFTITLEKDGKKIQKTLVLSEENSEFLFIDGTAHTSDSKKFDYVTLKCD